MTTNFYKTRIEGAIKLVATWLFEPSDSDYIAAPLECAGGPLDWWKHGYIHRGDNIAPRIAATAVSAKNR